MCFADAVSVISSMQIWAVELAPEETEAESLNQLCDATELVLNLGHLKPKLTDLLA